jgi:hypothetical protein
VGCATTEPQLSTTSPPRPCLHRSPTTPACASALVYVSVHVVCPFASRGACACRARPSRSRAWSTRQVLGYLGDGNHSAASLAAAQRTLDAIDVVGITERIHGSHRAQIPAELSAQCPLIVWYCVRCALQERMDETMVLFSERWELPLQAVTQSCVCKAAPRPKRAGRRMHDAPSARARACACSSSAHAYMILLCTLTHTTYHLSTSALAVRQTSRCW